MKIGVIALKKVLAGVALAGVLTLSAGTVAAQAAPGYPASLLLTTDLTDSPTPGMVTFSGSGFIPGETIDITVAVTDLDNGQSIGSLPASTTTADANGTFSVLLSLMPLVIDKQVQNEYSMLATGRMSGHSINQLSVISTSGPVGGIDDPALAKDGMIAGQDALAYTGIDAAGAAILSLLGVGVVGAGVGMVTVSRRRHGQPA
ncbi:hypothetical protein [Arthrobacter sp. E3]|uniref:hypothetical protein n=1 Tax=Arthrobacter sp. E3 TaxID=517402 RepID=UPI001A9451EB|nr:hypothetical protein [Arthrobacter sp. E3]